MAITSFHVAIKLVLLLDASLLLFLLRISSNVVTVAALLRVAILYSYLGVTPIEYKGDLLLRKEAATCAPGDFK